MANEDESGNIGMLSILAFRIPQFFSPLTIFFLFAPGGEPSGPLVSVSRQWWTGAKFVNEEESGVIRKLVVLAF
jgi:hypothetical protein